ncbi:hypothetical protein FWC31_00315 [Candidatus Saccharibacteria bacterium]|nr:hypothetical protein [Candidatus Saccharibacteria bacterium]
MKGKFIVIEGADGTGKKTQFDLLVEVLRAQGKTVLGLDFPRYDKPSAMYVTRYLNGEYGTDVAPDLAAMLYAFDRWQAKPDIEKFMRKNPDGVIVSNRYVASNLAHQGGKILDKSARRKFYDEQLELEFNQFGIPKPDLNLVLLLPESAAQTNVDKKAARNYTDKKRDIHEADLTHLQNATAAYRELVELYPGNFHPIDCWDETAGKMRTVEDISEEIKKWIDDGKY